MSKFKVGDKVVRLEPVGGILELTGTVNHTISGIDSTHVRLKGVDYIWLIESFKLDDWSIYNNTLPLSELSDEQRGLLFNYHFNGGDVLDFGTGDWIRCRYPTWDRNMEYRAKQKSERELFIDAARATGGGLSEREIDLVEAMFNVGFKAPKVGE